MGPGFESLKVHQEKRDVKLHLFFLATFVGGEALVRPIAEQWHEPRRGEVVPESLLLHSSFSLVALSGEEPHPNDGTGENEPLFSDVGSPRQRRHERRRREAALQSGCGRLRCRPSIRRANAGRKFKTGKEDACRPYLFASASVLCSCRILSKMGDRTHRTFRLNLPFPVNAFHFYRSRFCISWIGEVLLVCVL